MKTEVQKLQEYLDNEKKNGLVDFKFSLHHDCKGATLESVAREINQMLAAPIVSHVDLM